MSRGLGDVYKRQDTNYVSTKEKFLGSVLAIVLVSVLADFLKAL